MLVSQGKKHGYLVMDLNFYIHGEVSVSMVDYLRKVIVEFFEDIMNKPPTQTGYHLFKVISDKEINIFDKKQVSEFHHSVEQILFRNTRGRKDI